MCRIKQEEDNEKAMEGPGDGTSEAGPMSSEGKYCFCQQSRCCWISGEVLQLHHLTRRVRQTDQFISDWLVVVFFIHLVQLLLYYVFIHLWQHGSPLALFSWCSWAVQKQHCWCSQAVQEQQCWCSRAVKERKKQINKKPGCLDSFGLCRNSCLEGCCQWSTVI